MATTTRRRTLHASVGPCVRCIYTTRTYWWCHVCREYVCDTCRGGKAPKGSYGKGAVRICRQCAAKVA